MSGTNGHRVRIPRELARDIEKPPKSSATNITHAPQNTPNDGNSPHPGSPQSHSSPSQHDNFTQNTPEAADPHDGFVVDYSDPNYSIDDEFVEIEMRNGDVKRSTGQAAKELRDQQGGSWKRSMAFKVICQSTSTNEIKSISPIVWVD